MTAMIRPYASTISKKSRSRDELVTCAVVNLFRRGPFQIFADFGKDAILSLVTDPSVRRNGAGLEIFESSCFLRLISMRSLHRIGAKADTLTPYASATATVGIWHGAYLVEPHYSESIYVNMPRWVWLGREIICRMPDCAIVRGNALPWTDAAAPGGTAPRRLPLLPLPPHGPVRPNRH